MTVVLEKRLQLRTITFDTGKPHHIVIDASRMPETKGRYINDIDPMISRNCFPEKFFSEGNETGIKFIANRVVEAGQEFRYDYGFKNSP